MYRRAQVVVSKVEKVEVNSAPPSDGGVA